MGTGFLFTFHTKMKGVAIFIQNDLPFTTTNFRIDTQGQYIILSGMLSSLDITFVMLYVPNSFFSSFFASSPPPRMLQRLIHTVILGSEFIIVLNFQSDRSTPSLWTQDHPMHKEYFLTPQLITVTLGYSFSLPLFSL